MRFVILGAGILGRVLGGHLIRAGHEVSFHAREEQAESLREHGFQLVEVPGERETGVLGVEVTTGELDASDADWLLVCVRYDQLGAALAIASDAPAPRVVVASPVWRAEDATAHLPDWVEQLCFFPGLLAYADDSLGESIRYRSGMSIVGPLAQDVPSATAQGLADTLSRAGIRTRAMRNPTRVTRPALAGMLPFALAMETVDFSLASLFADGNRMRDVGAATAQAVAAVGGAASAAPAVGAASRILQMVPTRLLGLGSFALPFVPRDLIATTEQHTRKVARQTHLLTRALIADAPTGSVPLVQRLLVDAEQIAPNESDDPSDRRSDVERDDEA